MPISLVAEEFDATLPRRQACFGRIEASIYEAEISKIEAMDENQRKEFDHDMLRARGMTPCETGGVYCRGVGQGDNAWGFAIDHLTLQNVITDRFGEHQLAKHYLLERLSRIESLRTGIMWGDREKIEYPCARRILFGLILQKVRDFSTPIVCMWREDADDEQCRKVAKYILQERKFIPVTPDGFMFGTGKGFVMQ